MTLDCRCGVAALGSCSTCRQGFCLTHQARSGSFEYVDLCTFCQADRFVARAESDRQAQSFATQEKQRIEECVRLLHRAGGFGTQKRYATRYETKPTLFGRKAVTTSVEVEPAWPIGNLSWEESESRTGGGVHVVPSGITAKLKFVNLGRELRDSRVKSPTPPLDNDVIRRQVLNALESLVTKLRSR